MKRPYIPFGVDQQGRIDYSKHTAADDSREGCAGDDDPHEGAGAVVVPFILLLCIGVPLLIWAAQELAVRWGLW